MIVTAMSPRYTLACNRGCLGTQRGGQPTARAASTAARSMADMRREKPWLSQKAAISSVNSRREPVPVPTEEPCKGSEEDRN